MKFAEFKFDERILRGVEEAGFDKCTKVQQKVFEQTLNGKDVVVQSQTGTGKTAAFLVSLFQKFLSHPEESQKALVIVPTRELAVQIQQEAERLGKFCGLTSGSFFGGVSYGKQESMLAEGLNIYIGTPGRLIDFYKSKKLNLSDMSAVVIDEADRMFDMGFIRDIRYLLRKCPPAGKRLTMLFSATLGLIVKQMSWEFMQEPADIEIDPENITVGRIEQALYHVSSRDKTRLLLGILKKDNPSSGLIFCNTRRMTEILAHRLKGNGYQTEFISGDLPQKKRLRLIERIKKGEVRFVVATDVAARGLDVADLPLVINFDLPEEATSYVHRIGRTARAGKEGRALSLIDERSVYNLDAIQKLIEMKIPELEVDETMFEEDQSTPFHSHHKDKDRHDRHDRKRPERGRKTLPVRKEKSVIKRTEKLKETKPETSSSEKKTVPASVRAGRRVLTEKGVVRKDKKAKDLRFDKKTKKRPERHEVKGKSAHKQKTSTFSKITGRVNREMSIKERKAFYEKKYGNEFKIKKKGLIPFLQKVFGLD